MNMNLVILINVQFYFYIFLYNEIFLYFIDPDGLIIPLTIVSLIGIFAFVLLILEYNFVQKSSSLSLTVAGHLKDIV